MDRCKIISLKKLPYTNISYKRIDGTYDNTFYYLAIKNAILKMNFKAMKYSIIKTSHNYEFITYDERNKEFIAINYNKEKKIYFLDKNFNEKECVKLNIKEDINITSINYCSKYDCIIISSRLENIFVDKNGNKITSPNKWINCNNYISVYAIGFLYVILFTYNNKSYINLYYKNKIIDSYTLSKKIYYPLSILHAKYLRDRGILKIKLLTTNSHYDYFIASIDIWICNYKDLIYCDKYDFMESVALIEAGLSHIINAEGEKIQKAIKLSKCVDDLICVNESVNKTLQDIVVFESVLYNKLLAVLKKKV